jgi:hypothetical protein
VPGLWCGEEKTTPFGSRSGWVGTRQRRLTVLGIVLHKFVEGGYIRDHPNLQRGRTDSPEIRVHFASAESGALRKACGAGALSPGGPRAGPRIRGE